MSDNHISSTKNAIDELLSQVNTSLPGIVESYDPTTRRATVRPSLSKQLADGSVLSAPTIVSVPVVFTTSGGAGMTFPVSPGDGVILHFSQRSLDAWHDSGNAIPDDPRMYDLSDAIAVPGLNHGGATRAAHPVNVEMYFNGASVQITPAGEIILTPTTFITLMGPLRSNFPITSMNVTLHSHFNTKVMPGAGVSGPPQQGT